MNDKVLIVDIYGWQQCWTAKIFFFSFQILFFLHKSYLIHVSVKVWTQVNTPQNLTKLWAHLVPGEINFDHSERHPDTPSRKQTKKKKIS